MRLVICDVDGTLVDSQDDICAAMGVAFESVGLDTPDRATIKGIVGLSLPEAMARLAPNRAVEHAALVEGYKAAYMSLRAEQGAAQSSPLFEGARDVLEALRAEDETFLAVATGKSRRGLDKLIAGHELEGYFHSEQVADNHPSKPHPSMLEAALRETGCEAHQAVMVGDTTYDMDMARAAKVKPIGVSWGYHEAERLDADALVHSFAELPAAIDALLGE